MIQIEISKTDLQGYSKSLSLLKSKLTSPLHFLHSPDYGAWQEKARVEVVYFTVQQAGKLIGCGLATKLLAPGGFYYFYCPYGPLLTGWNKNIVKKVQDFFRDNFDKKLLFVRLDCELPDTIAKPAKPAVASTSALQPRTEWLLNITPSEDQLLANAHRKCRYHIKLSQRNGVSVRIEKCDVGQLDTFYDLLKTTGERDGFSLHSKEHYRAALESLGKSAFIGYALIEDKPVAASLCYIYDNQAHYIYGSSANEHRELGIGYLLQWSCIQEAKSRGATLYNFGGIAGGVKGEHLAGVTKFKQRFGGFSKSHSLPTDLPVSKLGYYLFSAYKSLRS